MKRGIFLSVMLGVFSPTAQAHRAADLRPALIQPGGLPVFFSSEGPLAYAALTKSEIPEDAIPLGSVAAKSCQFSLSVPIAVALHGNSFSGAIGDGTYSKILREMERDHSGLRGIYNAKVDLHQTTFLGIFGRLCTEIVAEGFR